MPDRWVSADTAAAMTGLSVRTLRRRAAAGAVRTQRTADKHVSYLAEDLERLSDTSDTARPPVRIDESDSVALLREMVQQNLTLARRVGQLEQQVEQLQAERDRLLEGPPAEESRRTTPQSEPERPRPWWRRLLGRKDAP